ncbi:MAG: transporter [Deltaproteobacteria bacterium]|nr:MAG: transporter [Deltaproteobacteria bacterium]
MGSMNPWFKRHQRLASMCLLMFLCAPSTAFAQDFEPRRWTQLPVGTNVVGVGYSYTSGEIDFNPALRIEDTKFDMHTAVLGYARYLAVFGRTARIDVKLPFQSGDWNGRVNGQPASTSRTGMADPELRFSVNLIGAPAMRLKEFMKFRKEHESTTSLGLAVGLRLPLGEYSSDKLINLGENRFTITPQLGVLHTYRRWSFELTATTFFFTDNNNFFSGNDLEQDPILALQAHVVKTFSWGPWIAAGVAYGWNGETYISGQPLGDEKNKLLYGVSFGVPIAKTQSLRVGYLRGDTLTDVGTDSHSVFFGWVWRF